MAKKCSVRSLSDSSLGELANLIVSTLGYAKYAPDIDLDINIVMVDINQYLETAGATSNIYQDLLRVILSSDYLDASMRFTCLQMLLNCGVSFLMTEVFPFSYYERILQVIAAQGAGLRVLNLKGIWVKEDHMHYMFEIVKKCQYLTKLYVPYIANDNLLQVISKHCERLQVLDISGETDITEIGIEYFSRGLCAQHVTVIDVGMPGEENICYSDVSLLLERCPNIETLSTYSFVGPALKFIYHNVDKNFTCKLKYLHDTGSDEETVKIIVKTCPKLESLYLDTPKLGCLRALGSTFLRKLKIYKFSSNELIKLLETIGQNLIHLTMIKSNGDLDLNVLARMCPGLIDLDCYMMDSLIYANSNKCRFTCLEGLEMLSSPMSNIALKTIISNNIQLKRLAVDNVLFNDEDIVSIFIEHDFNKLEDVWFTLAPHLTVQSIELCDHQLKIHYVDSSHPGACHDSFIWNTSDLRTYFEQRYLEGETNFWLLGDAGYPLEPWLLTPHLVPEDGTPEMQFNDTHTKCRNIIERTNGMLKNRWRCLLGTAEKVAKIINVCCALHNICMYPLQRKRRTK